MIGTARHYDDVWRTGRDEDTYRWLAVVRHPVAADADIDRYDEAEVICERDTDDDGVEIIRIKALAGEPDDWPLGRPGVSIELSMDDAIDLMAQLSELTLPPSLR